MSEAKTATQQRGPVQSPAGWLGLHFAINWFASEAVGKTLLSGTIVEDAETGDAEAGLYLFTLCASFASAVRGGKVRAGHGLKGGGPVQDMDPEAWQTTDPITRFRGYGFDPVKPYAEGYDLPCWAYVRAGDLQALCGEIRQWREMLPHYQSQEIPEGGLQCLNDKGAPVRLLQVAGGVMVAPPGFPDFESVSPMRRKAPSLKLVGNPTRAKPTPGPDLDLEWRDVVFSFCEAAKPSYVASDMGARIFHREVVASPHAKHHKNPPKDANGRRTDYWRTEWLKRRAQLPPEGG